MTGAPKQAMFSYVLASMLLTTLVPLQNTSRPNSSLEYSVLEVQWTFCWSQSIVRTSVERTANHIN